MCVLLLVCTYTFFVYTYTRRTRAAGATRTFPSYVCARFGASSRDRRHSNGWRGFIVSFRGAIFTDRRSCVCARLLCTHMRFLGFQNIHTHHTCAHFAGTARTAYTTRVYVHTTPAPIMCVYTHDMCTHTRAAAGLCKTRLSRSARGKGLCAHVHTHTHMHTPIRETIARARANPNGLGGILSSPITRGFVL